MTFSTNMELLGLSPREVQTQYAEVVDLALADAGGKISLLNAETGVGKSLGYLLPAVGKWWALAEEGVKARIIVATHSHALMGQLLDADVPLVNHLATLLDKPAPRVGRLLGRANYVSAARVSRMLFLNSGLPAADRNILAKLEEWTGTIAEFCEEYGELPVGVTEDDICLTPECEQDEFSDRQLVALHSDIVLTTHAMVCADLYRNNRLLGIENVKTILIVDEADAMVEHLRESQQNRLNLIRLRNDMSDFLTAKQRKDVDAIIEQVADGADEKQFRFTQETREKALDVLKKIQKILAKTEAEKIKREVERWLLTVRGNVGIGVSRVRHEPALVTLNPYFSRTFTGYAARCYQATLLTSATLSITHDPKKGMQPVRSDLGIDDEHLGQVGMFAPKDYGRMTMTLAGSRYPELYVRGEGKSPRLNPLWIRQVASDISTSDEPTVVLTASHNESLELASALAAHNCKVHLHRAGEPLRKVIDAFRQEPALLLTAAGHVGLNIRKDDGTSGFSRLVITRVAYGQPNDDAIKALADYYRMQGVDMLARLKQESFVRSQNSAIRKIKQALGRGIRAPEDQIDVVILDPRFPVEGDISSRYAALRNVISTRFKKDYQDARVLMPLVDETEEVLF